MRSAHFAWILYVALIAICSTRLQAQRRSDSQATPTTIQEAEAEGAAFPREAPPPSPPDGFRLSEAICPAYRTCSVMPAPVVRSVTIATGYSIRYGELIVRVQIIEGHISGIAVKVLWAQNYYPGTRKLTFVVLSVRLHQPARSTLVGF